MRQGLTMDEARDMYNSIAPDAFAKFGARVVPFIEHNFFTPPNDWEFMVNLLGGGKAEIAETAFWPYSRLHETPDPALRPALPAVSISLNPYYLPGLFEDELEVILLHEIAHAAGPFADAHGDAWRNRARALHPVAGDYSFRMRDWDMHPYWPNSDPGGPPSLL